MSRWKLKLFTTLIVVSLSSVIVQQTLGQVKKKSGELSGAKQEVTDKVFEEAKRYLLDKKFATEEQIERAVKTRGQASVVQFARRKSLNSATRLKRKPQRKGERKPSGGHPSVGLTPLSDLGSGKYKGHQGGLYPGGKNTPPEGHLKAALTETAKIRPLDADGRPAADGKIVLISNGMSNTTQEFSAFIQMAKQDAQKSSHVVIVDCAQGGMEASMWADPDKVKKRDRRSPWDVQDQRLKAAAVSPKQVQVVWIKQARALPESLGEFPKHAEVLKQDLVVVLGKLKQRFPNLRLAYLSSRIYAGYAGSRLNPEPFSYEGAFSVRWLIEDQIAGERALNYDPAKGEVKAPLLLWGPYLWADGLKGRQSDDLVWKREDLAGDGTHPSNSGRRKVARQLLRFFKSDPTAQAWFLDSATSSVKRRTQLITSKWEGTWQTSAGDPGGELKCVARPVEGDRWEATFSGYCNRQFVYEVKMNGRQVGKKIFFTGKADLGDKDGGDYRWTGELADGRFKGNYKSDSGKTGSFEMKPVIETGK